MNLEDIKKLAKQIWEDTDCEGNSNDYYYFEYGFIFGLRKGYHLHQQRLEALEKLSEIDQELGLM